MLEFSKRDFARFLHSADQKTTLFEKPEHSPYIQKVMDEYADKGFIDLTTLNLDAFELRHVTPTEYERAYNSVSCGWIEGFIGFCRKTPAIRLRQRTFF